MPELDYKSHRRYVPLYHFVTTAILGINLVAAVVKLFYRSSWATPGVSFDTVLGVLVAIALILLFAYVRTFPLKVQDRVIQLEERERLGRLLGADLRDRIGELSTGQLIALRFAPDAEVPELVRAVLDEKITGREAIKQRIKTWRPDDLRI
jgi:hypothetical protein